MSKRSERHRKARMIKAATAAIKAAESINFDGPLTIEAAAGDSKGPRRFNMVAYTGGKLTVSAYPVPIVVDLQGMSYRNDQIPTYLGHSSGSDASQLVGHSDQHSVENGRLTVSGAISAANANATEVLGTHDNGYAWQASIGVQPDGNSIEQIRPGQSATVNGQRIAGPVLVARKSQLYHIAILPEGADSATSLQIAAKAATNRKAYTMTPFEQWQSDLFDGDVPEFTDAQTSKLEARYQAELDAAPPVEGKKAPPIIAKVADTAGIEAEYTIHISRIEATAAGYEGKIEADKMAPIMATARKAAADLKVSALQEKHAPEVLASHLLIEANKAAEAMLDSRMTTAPLVHGSSRDKATPEVIEAALCLQTGMAKPEDHFNEETLNVATSKEYRNFGLQQLLIQAAAGNGMACRPGTRVHNGNIREVLEYAFPPRIHAQTWSGIDVSGILSNTGNKVLLAGFEQAPQKWREVASIQTVSDFKTVTRYRMTASLEYEEVPPGGEIPHGSLGEESYTIKADTYAKMIALTRQDIINDDLGAFDDIRRRLGIGAAQKMDDLFWTLWINNTSFFTAARLNFQDGAATTLDTTGLNSAVKLFRELPSPDGSLMNLDPNRLIVPPALEATAKQIFVSSERRDTTASTETLVANIYQSSYRPVVVPQLGNSNYTGYSDLKWYLLADPAILATAAMCFLNGQQSPTVESADADFNTLGIQIRGYHDFGVNFTEYRAGIASKGEA